MWCPRCNRQYDDEFENCLVCSCPLEEYTPILSEEEREVLDLDAFAPNPEELTADTLPELLVSVVGEEEARRLAKLLQGFRIPCLCRLSQEEVEEELTSDQEVYDLLVPKMMLSKAIHILNEDAASLDEEEVVEVWEEELREEDDLALVDTTEKKKKKRWGIFGKKD